MGDLLPKESLGSLLHLGENHGADLLGGEGLGSLAGIDLHVGLGRLLDRFEGIEFDIILNSLVRPVTTDHPLGVEHGVLGIGGQLVLGSVSYQPFSISGKSDITGGDPVSLVIRNYFNTPILENTDTEGEKFKNVKNLIPIINLPRIGGAKINTNNCSKILGSLFLFC